MITLELVSSEGDGKRSEIGDWLIFPAKFEASCDYAIDFLSLLTGKKVPVPLQACERLNGDAILR